MFPTIRLRYFSTRLLIAVAVPALWLTACDDEAADTSDVFADTAISESKNKSVSPLEGCYTMIQNRDTVHLMLSVKDTGATGQLQYKRFEKDRNDGILKGVVRKDVIVGNYVFQSEGAASIREVVFRIKGDSLFEGYGEVKVSGNTTKFANIKDVKFMTTPLVKGPCENK